MLLSLHQKGTGKKYTGKNIPEARYMHIIISSCDADAVSSLEVSIDGGNVVDGALQVCPDTTVSLTCSHDSTGNLTRWVIGAPIECSGTATHTTTPSDALCEIFTISMVSAMNQPHKDVYSCVVS